MISTSTISEAKPAVAPLLFLGGSKSQPVWINQNLNKSEQTKNPNQGPVSHSPKIQPSSIPAQPYIKMVIWCVTQVLRVKAAQRKCRRRSWQLGPCSCVPVLYIYIYIIYVGACLAPQAHCQLWRKSTSCLIKRECLTKLRLCNTYVCLNHKSFMWSLSI